MCTGGNIGIKFVITDNAELLILVTWLNHHSNVELKKICFFYTSFDFPTSLHPNDRDLKLNYAYIITLHIYGFLKHDYWSNGLNYLHV